MAYFRVVDIPDERPRSREFVKYAEDVVVGRQGGKQNIQKTAREEGVNLG